MKKPKKKSLAERLRAELKARGITAYRVSKDTGINETTAARFMRGDGEPTLSNADLIIDLLGWEVVEHPAKK